MDDTDYQAPFRFTGKPDKLTLSINRPKLTPEDEQKFLQATRNNKAGERFSGASRESKRLNAACCLTTIATPGDSTLPQPGAASMPVFADQPHRVML